MAQVLDGCIKQKKRGGYLAQKKKANAGAITLLRKKYTKTVGIIEGQEGRGNYRVKLADSSPLHTPLVSRWCGEDEEG